MKTDRLLQKLAGEKLARRIWRETNIDGVRFAELVIGARDLAESDWDALITWLRDQCPQSAQEPSHADPFELARLAGYTLHGPLQFADFAQFRRYYRRGEELCKFGDPSRPRQYKCYWLVRDGADEIEPELPLGTRDDSTHRDGPYGTSVMSVELADGITRICNRYNHAVRGCDHTLDSNLDRVYPGLAAALAAHAGVTVTRGVSISNAIIVNGQMLVYTDEIAGVHFNRYEHVHVSDGKIALGRETGERIVANMRFNIRDARQTCQINGTAPWTWLPDGVRVIEHASWEAAEAAEANNPQHVHIVISQRSAK